jgi:hypothetical protein
MCWPFYHFATKWTYMLTLKYWNIIDRYVNDRQVKRMEERTCGIICHLNWRKCHKMCHECHKFWGRKMSEMLENILTASCVKNSNFSDSYLGIVATKINKMSTIKLLFLLFRLHLLLASESNGKVKENTCQSMLGKLQ